jgi:hypothetical protein
MYCPSEAHIVLSPVTPEKHKEDRSIKNGKQDALWSVESAMEIHPKCPGYHRDNTTWVCYVIKRVSSCDQKDLFMWSKGSVHVIKRACSCDQKGLFMWSKGSVHVIKRACSCDQKGLFMWSKGSVHANKTKHRPKCYLRFLKKTHECMFIQISRETMLLLINNLHKSIRDNQIWTWPSVGIFPAI